MTDPPDNTVAVSGNVCDAREEHLEALVACHVAALPDDVITLLGRAFLRTHYRFYQHHPKGICLVVPDGRGGVAGFVIGGPPTLRSQFARRHCCRTAWCLLTRSLASRRVRARFASLVCGALRKVATEARLLRPRPIEPVALEPADHHAVLLTLGTRPDCRGHGVGEALTRAFGQRCRELGFDAAYLMTRCDNAPDNRIYAKLGWQLVAVRKGFNHYRLEVPRR